jgi:four helix bundle protein
VSYRNFEIWKLARELSIEIHKMTMEKLPKFEMFEEGTQIRRSSKSVRSNIVEGYGRRNYKMDYIKHLLYAQASNDETIDHLETLFETKSLTDELLFNNLSVKLNTEGKKINKFIQSIQNSTSSTKQPETRDE